MLQHSCLKCSAIYEDEELDNYYCPACCAQKKAIAKDLDKKFNTRGQVPNSGLTQFEATSTKFTTANGRTITFGKA